MGFVDIEELVQYMEADNEDNNNTVMVEMNFDGKCQFKAETLL